MRKFQEKSVIALLCLFSAYGQGFTKDLVLGFLIVLIISFSLDLVANKKYRLAFYFLFLILLVPINQFIFYLPLVLYNLYLDFKIFSVLAMLPMFNNFSLLNILISLVSVYFSIKTDEFHNIIEDNNTIQDELRE